GFTGLTTQTNFHRASSTITDPRLSNGQAGTLTVNADTLTIKRGANITADNFAFGKVGDITINVRDLLLSRDGAPTGGISTQSTLAGEAGNIPMRAAGRIELNESGGIISLTAPPATVSTTGGVAPLDVLAVVLSPMFQARFRVATPNFAALVAAIERQGVPLP